MYFYWGTGVSAAGSTSCTSTSHQTKRHSDFFIAVDKSPDSQQPNTSQPLSPAFSPYSSSLVHSPAPSHIPSTVPTTGPSNPPHPSSPTAGPSHAPHPSSPRQEQQLLDFIASLPPHSPDSTVILAPSPYSSFSDQTLSLPPSPPTSPTQNFEEESD